MNYTNLKVNENCIKCGSCLGCGYDFLSSANDGSIVIKDGTMLESNCNEFKTLADICPVEAFELFDLKPLTKQDLNEFVSKSDLKALERQFMSSIDKLSSLVENALKTPKNGNSARNGG